MSALFICPHCRSVGLQRIRLPAHDAFECRVCKTQYPIAPTDGLRDPPTRRVAEAARRNDLKREDE